MASECRLTFFPRNNGERMPLHCGVLTGRVVNPDAVTWALAAAASQLPLCRAPSWALGAVLGTGGPKCKPRQSAAHGVAFQLGKRVNINLKEQITQQEERWVPLSGK